MRFRALADAITVPLMLAGPPALVEAPVLVLIPEPMTQYVQTNPATGLWDSLMEGSLSFKAFHWQSQQ